MTIKTKNLRTILTAGALAGLAACGGSSQTDQEKVASAMQTSMKGDLTTLWMASQMLKAAAPMPSGRGWDATMDAAAISSMKDAWKMARQAYEHVEGATAPIFSDIDVEIDERYDGFLANSGPDDYLFDDMGVTGMHAIERILYVDTTPANVVQFEMTLPGYKAAAFPATEQEASDFKNKLCARLVTNTKQLLDGWTTAAKLDVSGAFDGLISLVNEQQEKINNASLNVEESRYSQRTLADLRDNLAGTTTIYGLFRDWLETKPASGGTAAGTDIDASITAGLSGLGADYDAIQGDALPKPPATWSAEAPTTADLATPFGQLYSQVHAAVDPSKADSIVSQMNDGAKLLGIDTFQP
ncbi:MAG TPA: imelysin family protein [Polyangia bacterium]|nr:imelysin family protein [Polyangia bacterium]